MKKCPSCGRSYADDSLRFCMDDGNFLAPVYDDNSSTLLNRSDRVGSYAGFEELSHQDSSPNSYARFEDLEVGSFYGADELEIDHSSKKEKTPSEEKESPGRLKKFFNRILGKDSGDSK